MKAIQIHKYGDPEVLSYEDAPTPKPNADEALIKTEAIGINFIDIYHRKGLYQQNLPFIPGMEASGIVEEIGKNAAEVKEGDRVAYAMQIGSYAEYAVVPSWKLYILPDNLDFKSGAAMMLQGMTAHYLTHSTYHLKESDTILVHAAAGGVGRLIVQIAKLLGATVIGTVSTEEKARITKEAGADHVIIYTETDFEEEVMKFTNNKGVDVVYDSVGKTTFEKSARCLKRRGYLAFFGQSSGAVGSIDLGLLSKNGLFITRPSLNNYVTNHEELLERANDLARWIESGELKLRIHETFPLENAKDAHELLENRKSAGKLLLVP